MDYNGRDFAGCDRFGIEALTPAAFLRRIGGYDEHTEPAAAGFASQGNQRACIERGDFDQINQFVATAVAEKMAALMTEDYLQERARRGSRAKYEAALAQVPDVEPDEYDRI